MNNTWAHCFIIRFRLTTTFDLPRTRKQLTPATNKENVWLSLKILIPQLNLFISIRIGDNNLTLPTHLLVILNWPLNVSHSVLSIFIWSDNDTFFWCTSEIPYENGLIRHFFLEKMMTEKSQKNMLQLSMLTNNCVMFCFIRSINEIMWSHMFASLSSCWWFRGTSMKPSP